MANYELAAKYPLDGVTRKTEGTFLTEITGKALVSVATPLGGEKNLKAAFAKSYKAKIPKVGHSTTSSIDNARLLGLQADQLFLYFDHENDEAVSHVTGKLGETGYYTDQSDSWVMLEFGGPKCHQALERICGLDLHPDVFVEGAVSRTMMEHMGVIILRSGIDEFTLFSARSSAKSFYHAIETSIANISD